MKFKVRLFFVDEPPNPRDEDEVILDEAIQEIAQSYNRRKDKEDQQDASYESQ